MEERTDTFDLSKGNRKVLETIPEMMNEKKPKWYEYKFASWFPMPMGELIVVMCVAVAVRLLVIK